jgi:uncharacterized protein (DUF488 family)
MKEETRKLIWTIGHSTRAIDELIEMLKSFQIRLVADVRNYPGSRRYPQFNKESLEISLPKHDIDYVHLKDLGGRRKAKLNSTNTMWRNEAFRGYADYMETDDFKKGVKQLEMLGDKYRTAFMCSEAVWWRCHRSLISDYLKSIGCTVMHIMKVGKAEEHPYTSAARILNGELTYRKNAGDDLFANSR